MRIADGVVVESDYGLLGVHSDSTGTVNIEGVGSIWNAYAYFVGYLGNGTLNITGGGQVGSPGRVAGASVGYGGGGTMNVDGIGSEWNGDMLYDGRGGEATTTISRGGLVCVCHVLTNDEDLDGDSFVNMASGGMLALYGDPDGSISEFLDLVKGSDAGPTFETEGVGRPKDQELIPFCEITHQPYIVYWDVFTESEWIERKQAHEAVLQRQQELATRTVDWLAIGEMQPERNHQLEGEKTDVGEFSGRKFRHAWDGGWFSCPILGQDVRPSQRTHPWKDRSCASVPGSPGQLRRRCLRHSGCQAGRVSSMYFFVQGCA